MIAAGDRVRLPAAEGGVVGVVVRAKPMGPTRTVLVVKTADGIIATGSRGVVVEAASAAA